MFGLNKIRKRLGKRGQVGGLKTLLLALVFIAIIAVVLGNVLLLFGLTNVGVWPIVTFLVPIIAIFVTLKLMDMAT